MTLLCSKCNAEVSKEFSFCPKCGTVLLNEQNLTEKPAIWNPYIVANLCLLFSPLFSTIIQYINWNALKQKDKAKLSRIWIFTWIAILIIFLVLGVILPIEYLNIYISCYTIILIFWYFINGKNQSEYVKEKYGTEYKRKTWEIPLSITIGGLVTVCYCTFVIFNFSKKSVDDIIISDESLKKYRLDVSQTTTCNYNLENEKYDSDCYTEETNDSIDLSIGDSVVSWNGYNHYIINKETKYNSDDDKVLYYKTKLYLDKKERDIDIYIGKDFINYVRLFDFVKYHTLVSDTNYYSGSGFAVSENHLITNYHVIKSMERFIIKNDKNSIIYGKIKFTDPDIDLAIIETEQKLNACAIDDKIYNVGTDVYVWGYPRIGEQGRSIKVTKGIISSKYGFRDEIKHYQIDAAVQNGNSGGPLIKDNKIIGIVVSMLTNGQNVNYAIKSKYLTVMLEAAGIKPFGKNKPNDCTYLLIGSDK